MKYKLLMMLIVVLLFTSFSLKQKYLIDVKLQPNNVYRLSNKTDTHSEVDYRGDEKILNQLRNNGVKFPLDVNVNQLLIQKVETGNIKSDSSFNVKMTIEDFSKKQTVNNVESDTPKNQDLKGLIILGDYTKEKKLENIIIEGDNISDELKNTLPKAMENILKILIILIILYQ